MRTNQGFAVIMFESLFMPPVIVGQMQILFSGDFWIVGNLQARQFQINV